MSKTLILLTAEPDNWAPKELVAKAEAIGFTVEVINPDTCFFMLDDEPFIAHNGKRFEGADIVIPRLSENDIDYKIAIVNHLEKMDIKVLNTGKSLRTASNKVETQILLNDVGLKTPKTVMFTSEKQIDSAIKALGNKFPIIIKTLFGTHGIGVMRADSKASLISIAQQLLKTEEQFMLQEYIDHKESGRILLLNGQMIAAVMRTVPDDSFRSNAHQGAEVKLHEPSQEELEVCIKAADRIGINLAAVDYIVDGDDIILLEVNGSPGFEAMQDVIEESIAQVIIDYCAKEVGLDSEEHEEHEEHEKNETPEEEAKEEEAKEEEAKEVTVPTHDIKNDKVIGTITNVVLKYFNDDQPIKARVDTGATLSSIHGENIELGDNFVKFTFNNIRYKFHLAKMTKIKQANSETSAERPVINVDLVIDGITLRNIPITISDRTHMEYDILLGRQVLAAGGFLINAGAGQIDDNEIAPIEHDEEDENKPEIASETEGQKEEE